MKIIPKTLWLSLWLAIGWYGTQYVLSQDTILQTEPGTNADSPVTFQTLSDDQATSNEHKRSYLESNGWAYNCDNPGSLWLWAKVLNGKEYRLELETALYIQVQAETRTVSTN